MTPNALHLLEQLCAPACSLRVLLVSAHPDDETIGAGARLSGLGDVSILQVTDGAPHDGEDARARGLTSRDEYARMRRREREHALALAHVSPRRVFELGVMDQRATHQVSRVARAVHGALRANRPQIVLTHAYEGGHPDHDATAFAVSAAVRMLREDDRPVVVEMLGYHAGPSGDIQTGEFLDGGTEVLKVVLDRDARTRKLAMMRCYASQQRVLSQFGVDVECFRIAPAYDFTQPPHDGTLWYERWTFGMPGSAWRALCAGAMSALGLEAAAPA